MTHRTHGRARKVIAVLSYRLCVYSRWPLTRARAGPTRQGWHLRLPRGGVWAPRPTHNLEVGAGGASGKSAKRCLWQKKRADFEEVPRLAATSVAGNRMTRRWAVAAPYEALQVVQWGGRLQGSPLRRLIAGFTHASKSRVGRTGASAPTGERIPTSLRSSE